MFRKLGSWFSGLSKAGKTGVVLASLFVVGAAASPATTPPQTGNQSSNQTTQKQESETKADTVETKTITETESIPFKKLTKEDGTLDKGKTALETTGVNGVKTLTYEVTLTNGEETDRKLIKEEVTKAAVNQVTLIGSYTPPQTTQSNCHPSYTGACVPYTSDVDCAGGRGNGPAYVGFVTVVGPDVYGLDRDGDGYGCE